MSKSEMVDYSFSMKHRLIGAAILITFAVLLLPWMLGSYSADSSLDSNISQAGNGTPTDNDQGQTKLVQADNNEQVFISRVQPVDTAPKQDNMLVGNLDEEENKKEQQAEEKKAPVTEAKETPKQQTKPDTNQATPQEKSSSTAEKKEKSESPSKTVLNKPVEEKPITRGYIVSIGVFGDQKNADKLVVDLEAKKFEPKTRKEQFKGKQVTRIYMGPFATRSEAGKLKLRLAEEQNIPGLVKAFP